MNLTKQVNDIKLNIGDRAEDEILKRVQAILHKNFPLAGIYNMTKFRLEEFMVFNNLSVEIKLYNGEILRANEIAFSLNTSISVRVFRKEELL